MDSTDGYLLDPQLWHACAGGMPQIPPVNSKVYYFPQGHAEHASKKIDFLQLPRISPHLPCRIESIKYLADSESEEVFVKIGLVPLKSDECDVDEEGELVGFVKNEEKSFAKTLTQSDANNGGGFSVPRYCAETIFPLLDLKADPPVQTISVKDVRGEEWKFRHIYRGTPRRHLLTTGWSNFVNKKKLVAGDSIVFARAENNELCVGVRRAKKVFGGGDLESSSGWNARSFFGMKNVESGGKGRGNVSAESVLEAASLAVNGKPFEVVYYPCTGTPEFVVRISAVKDAMRVPWCAGMRFKMPFETDDSNRKSLFVGTISNVQVHDPVQWPNSPWKFLQVTWDEPDLLPNLKRVNPWLVELVSSIPTMHPFQLSSLPSKRPRFAQASIGQFPLLINPLSPSSPLCCLDNISAGIQGARHAQYVLPSPDFKFNLVQTGFDFKQHDFATEFPIIRDNNPNFSAAPLKKETKNEPAFILFGQPIHTQEQMTESSSSDGNQENGANVSNGSESAVIQNTSSQAEASSSEELSRFKEI